MHKISVVIPVYNTEKYIEKCICSVIGQSFNDIEIICINDGSTDGSFEILKKYEEKDNRIKIHSQQNKGVSAARNAGIRLSQGEYLYFLDSDDFLLEMNALELLYNEAYHNNLDIVYFDAKTLFDTDALADEYFDYLSYYTRPAKYNSVSDGLSLFNALQRDGMFCSIVQLQFINKNFLESIKLYFYEGIYHEDELFTMFSMLKAKRVCHLNLLLLTRRIREGSIITQEKNFNHFYGYLTCYIQLSLYLSDSSYTDNEMKYIIDRMNTAFLSSAVRIYRKYNGAEQGWHDNLSEFERDMLTKMTDEFQKKQYFLPIKCLKYVVKHLRRAGFIGTVKKIKRVIAKRQWE